VGKVARNVRQGRGLKTDVIYPLHAAIGRPDAGRHDIAVGPLYPLALGMFFKGRGADDGAVALFNGILLFITAAFLYGVVKLAYDKSIAVWTILAYFVSMKAISQALGAGGATIGALGVTAALYFALMAVSNAEREPAATGGDDRPSVIDRVKAFLATPWPWAVLAALTIGLSYLTGMVGWLAIAGLVWLASRHGPHTRRNFAIIALIAIIVTAPWLARNLKHFGWPVPPLSRYSLVMLTAQFPGNSLMWQTSGAPASPELWALTNPGEMVRKFGVGLTNLYGVVPEVINRYLFPFLLAGVFVLAKDRRQRLLWGMVWFVLLAQVLTVAIYDRDGDPLGVVTPVALGLAMATLIGLMRTHLTVRRAFVGTAIAAGEPVQAHARPAGDAGAGAARGHGRDRHPVAGLMVRRPARHPAARHPGEAGRAGAGGSADRLHLPLARAARGAGHARPRDLGAHARDRPGHRGVATHAL